MNIPTSLIENIKQGNVVLFLGAGACIGAKHLHNESPPIGAKLAEKLAEKFLGDNYIEQPLPFVSELCISEHTLFAVQSFIAEIFKQFAPANHHLKIATFKWKAIFTTNYDQIIEDVYRQSNNRLQDLSPVYKNTPVQQIFKSEKSLPYYKLHGCISNINDIECPLILTPDQYLDHRNNRDRLFKKFEELAQDYPILFIGYSLADPDIRAILAELEKLKSGRPRSFIVGPNIKEIESRYWESKKLTSITSAFKDFIEELDLKIEPTLRALSIVRNSEDFPLFEKFAVDPKAVKPTENLISYITNDIEYVHYRLSSPNTDSRAFYKGYFENWDPIIKNLDVDRSLKDGILSEVFLQDDTSDLSTQFYVVTGYAGSGKSVLLKRIAWEAATAFNKLCVFQKKSGQTKYDSILELHQFARERIFLFIDGIIDRTEEIASLLAKCRKNKIPLTVVAAERTNAWNTDCDSVSEYLTQEFKLRYLNDREILDLIALLDKHNSLGHLKKLNQNERIKALSEQAGRELLVALYEATNGKPFAEIILDEYNKINNETAKSLYLTVSILHMLGGEARAGLISRVHGIPFSEFQEKLFKPLEFIVFDKRNYQINDFVYVTRHRHIAEIIFDTVLTTAQDRYDEYIRILKNLDIDYDSDRNAYLAMTNAKKLLNIFNDTHLIEHLYAAANEINVNDGKLKQQEALFHLNSYDNNFSRAEQLLKEAYILIPNDPSISHSFAEMAFKKAELSQNKIERNKYIEESRAICLMLIKKNSKNVYPYHTILKVELLRLKNAIIDGDTPSIERIIKEIEQQIFNATQLFQNDSFIIEAEANYNQLIENTPTARKLLEEAFNLNKVSPYICSRLASLYIEEGAIEKAKDTIKETLNLLPHEKNLNFKYATLLSKSQNPDLTEVKYYYRRSFTSGDNRYEAQFWYARTLYLNNEISEAKEIFKSLNNASAHFEVKRSPRGRIKNNKSLVRFTGLIQTVETSYAFIRRDGYGDDIFLYRYHDNYFWEDFKRGMKVSFHIAFNFYGAVALDVKLMR